MGELKSAWEIAREKADRLGRLSAEERRQQKTEDCRQAGAAIAQRYLDSPDTDRLSTELGRHPEEERDMVREAAVRHLAEAMNPGSKPGTATAAAGNTRSGRGQLALEKIVPAIATLAPESAAVLERITGLSLEYQKLTASSQGEQEMEKRGRETLHQLRISGTAVGDINIDAAPQWQEDGQKLMATFEPRLEKLKQELMAALPQPEAHT